MFFLRNTPKGRGVFSDRDHEKGEKLLDFQGPLIHMRDVESGYEIDHSLQIGPQVMIGPSGGIDDLVNHSCDPNGGVFVRGISAILVAIRDIEAGEELSFDYSTTMCDDPWEMACRCGTRSCRGIVREFRTLPAPARRSYVIMGIVPWYCLAPAPAIELSLP